MAFINFQVKLVRWNYVIKKMFLYYFVVLFQAEWFFAVGQGTWVTQYDRSLFYLLCLDAMHNITTAFFLQTLKFKGFISAETFSFLFNASPLVGVILTYKLLMHHTLIVPYAVAGVTETAINLYLIYSNKSLSFEWKNRLQVLSKVATLVAATAYKMYVV